MLKGGRMSILCYSKDEIKRQNKELLNAFDRIQKGKTIRIPVGSPLTKKNVTLEAKLPYIVMNRSNSAVVKLSMMIREETKKRRDAIIHQRHQECLQRKLQKQSKSLKCQKKL